jgi:uncharacterized protein YpmS
MVMEYGKVFMETLILVNGGIQKLRVMEFILGRMEIGMKENGNCVSSMDKVPTFLTMEMSIQGNIRMENQTAEGNIPGETVRFM